MIDHAGHDGSVISVHTGRQSSIRAMIALVLAARPTPDAETVWSFTYRCWPADMLMLADLKLRAVQSHLAFTDDGRGWLPRRGQITVAGRWDLVMAYAAGWSNETGQP